MKKAKVLPPIHPNVGIEVEYRRRLTLLIDEMHRSISYWVTAAYRANEPVIAQDELPATALKAMMSELRRRWTKRFNRGAKDLAQYFATSASKRVDASLQRMLVKAGFSVEFRLTAAQRDVVNATVNQSVSLIRSIPQQYLAAVEGSVMRSVQTGRDMAALSKELQKHYGVTKRRAAFIARSQNNIATGALNKARQLELGITDAIWVHSGGGKEPRPSHVKAGREQARYKVAEGWFDPDEKRYVLPGELPNCRCSARSIIPSFI